MPDGGELRANLVRAARAQQALAEREPVPLVHRAVIGDGLLRAGLRAAQHARALLPRLLHQVVAQRALRVLHAPMHGAQVVLFHLAPADLRIHRAQRLPVLGEDDDAAGKAVDAVAQRRGEAARLRLPLALLVEVGLRIGQQRMHLLALGGVADQPGPLVEQHDVRILVEDRQLRADLRIERVLALRRGEPFVLHIQVDALALREHCVLVSAPAVHLHAPQAQEPGDLPHGGGGQRLLQKAGQPAAVPRRIGDDRLHPRASVTAKSARGARASRRPRCWRARDGGRCGRGPGGRFSWRSSRSRP